MNFLFVYRPLRTDFHPEKLTEKEARAVEEHFEFLKGHHEKDELYIAGRRQDGAFGFAVIEAEDLADALEKSQRDPAVKKGVFQVEVHPFQLALY